MLSATLVQSTVPLPKSLHRRSQQSYSEVARQAQRIAKITQNHTGLRRTMQNSTGKCRTSRTMLDQAGACQTRVWPLAPTLARDDPQHWLPTAQLTAPPTLGIAAASSPCRAFTACPCSLLSSPQQKLPAQLAKPLVPASLQNQAWSWLPEGPCPTLIGRCLIGYLTLSDKTISHRSTLFLKTQYDGSWSSLPPQKRSFLNQQKYAFH